MANGGKVTPITEIPKLTFDYDLEEDSELINAFREGFSLTFHLSGEVYAMLRDVLDHDAAERMLEKIKQAVKEYVKDVNEHAMDKTTTD